MTTTILRLEIIDNGSLKSLIDDHGRIWGTGFSAMDALTDAAWPARDEGYTDIAVGTQRWEIERLVDL